MMKYLVLLLILLVACVPQPATPKMSEQAKAEQTSNAGLKINAVPEVATKEEVVQAGVEEVTKETAPAPLETTGSEIQPYTKLGCEKLLTDADFAQVCGKADVRVTSQVGTANCYVNLKDYENERRTADVSLHGYKDAAAAKTEFDRRLKVLQVGADSSVGERAYTFPKLDRETLSFVKAEYIVDVGSDTHLCTKDQVKELALIVAGRLS